MYTANAKYASIYSWANLKYAKGNKKKEKIIDNVLAACYTIDVETDKRSLDEIEKDIEQRVYSSLALSWLAWFLLKSFISYIIQVILNRLMTREN